MNIYKDINNIYPVFSQVNDYKNLIKILRIAISRDENNYEYLSVLRDAYIKTKDYNSAEDIYQIMLKIEEE